MTPSSQQGPEKAPDRGDDPLREFFHDLGSRLERAWSEGILSAPGARLLALLGGLVLLVFVVGICVPDSEPDSPVAPDRPDNPGSAEATIDGSSVVFSRVVHHYQDSWQHTLITLENSTPAGWKVDLIWDGDVDPRDVKAGFSTYVINVLHTSAMEDEVSPTKVFYHSERHEKESASLTITSFASGKGDKTTGSFDGRTFRSDSSDRKDAVILEDGRFTAIRQ